MFLQKRLALVPLVLAVVACGDSSDSDGNPQGGGGDDPTGCELSPYDVGRPFVLTPGTRLPYGSADTSFAFLAVQREEGTSTAVTLASADVTESPSTFPGDLPSEGEFAAPATLGSATGGPYPATVPDVVGQTAQVSLYLPSGTGSVEVSVRLVNDVVIVAEDTTTPNPNGAVSLDSIEAVATAVGDYVLTRDQLALGPVTDVDSNGHVVIVLSPTIAALGAGGYMNTYDLLYERFDSGGAFSNAGEYIYLQCPNQGASDASIKAWTAHELGHLLHMGQKFVRGGISPDNLNHEAVLVTEGVAHLAQDLAGMGDDQAIILRYLLERPRAFALADLFDMDRPAPASTEDSFAQRGAAYTFLRYQFDRAGGADYSQPGTVADHGGIAYLRGYVANPGLGREVVDMATGLPLVDLWRDYLLALLLSGRTNPESAAPLAAESRFRFADRQIDSDTGQWQGFDPYGEVLVAGSSMTLSGPALSAVDTEVTLEPGQAAFFEIGASQACTVQAITASPDATTVDWYAVRVR